MSQLLRNSFALVASLFLGASLQAQPPLLATYEIQGTINFSPFLGQLVELDTAVVIAAGSGYLFVQDADGDGDPTTSDGLYLTDFGSQLYEPGQLVVAQGIVREIENLTALAGPGTTVTAVGNGPLPLLTLLETDTLFTSVPDLERLESMYLDFTATVGGPSDSRGEADIYTTPFRPMREPGVEIPGINGLPVYDGNPELIVYDPNGLGEVNNRFLNAGSQVKGIGILYQEEFGYYLSPVEPPDYTPFDPNTSVRELGAGELSVGSLNVLNLNDNADDYQIRLEKLATYISSNMNFPQILALQEIWGFSELTALSSRLRQIDPQAGDYRLYLGGGTGSISNGFLVHQDLPEPLVTELGTAEFISTGGILHDRPPLLLEIDLDNPGQTPLAVLNLHLRSLNGITGSNANFVRTKRQEQSISVAQMVADRIDENLVIVGDYNAFEFTDGYVDVVNQISGGVSLGAQRPVQDILPEPIRNLTVELLMPTDRYSFVFRGSAQVLDHCLSTNMEGLTPVEINFARGNCDAADAYESNSFSVLRSSDHDGFVLFLGIDDLSSTNTANQRQPDLRFPNPFPAGSSIELPVLAANSHLQLLNSLGQVVEEFALPQVVITGLTWQPTTQQKGAYFLRLIEEAQSFVYPIILE